MRDRIPGSEAYDAIAEELASPDITLAELTRVAEAKAYARRTHRKWPPRPARSPYDITITTWNT